MDASASLEDCISIQSSNTSRAMPTAAEKISQELWDMIADHLPALSARYAATVFGFRLRPQQEQHAEIWSAIFQDLTWISTASSTGCEPVLIGKDLDHRWGDSSQLGDSYLVLLAKPFESPSERKLFLQSLRDHQAQEDNRELELASGVTLNVARLYDTHSRIPVRITKLLVRKKRVRTALLFWQGSSIDSANLETIVGARGVGSMLKSFLGYRLTLKYLGGSQVQYRFESHSLKRPGMRNE